MRSMSSLLVAIVLPVLLPLQSGPRPDVRDHARAAVAPEFLDVNGAIANLKISGPCTSTCLTCDSEFVMYTDGFGSPVIAEETCTYLFPCKDCEATEDGTLASAMTVLHQAVNREGDSLPLTELLHGSSRLLYNAKRESLQVLSCDSKSVMATLPVAPGLREIAAAAARDNGRLVGDE